MLNKKAFLVVADTRKKLLENIDEIRAQEHRARYDLPVTKYSLTLKELFTKPAPTIAKPPQRKLFERVSSKLLSILPEDIKITNLKKAYFQSYIDLCVSQFGIQSKQPIKGQTVNRELNRIAAALMAASRYFAALDDYRKPTIPKAKAQNTRRDRIVDANSELYLLLTELRAKPTLARLRIADQIEF